MINKIKLKPNSDYTQIEYFSDSIKTEKTTKVTSTEERAPKFTHLIDELARVVFKRLELPDHLFITCQEIIQINFDIVGSVEVVSIVAKLDTLNHYSGKLKVETGYFNNGQVNGLIDRLKTAATKFIDGERAQADMFVEVKNND